MTHTYTLKVGEHTYTGELDISPSGLVAVKERNPLEELSGQMEVSAKQVFAAVGTLAKLGDIGELTITTKKERPNER